MAERSSGSSSVSRAGSSQQLLVSTFFPSVSSSETESSIGRSSRQLSTVDDSGEERGDGVPPDTREDQQFCLRVSDVGIGPINGPSMRNGK